MKWTYITSFLIMVIRINSQDFIPKKNSLYVEVFGNSNAILSINYERIFQTKKTNIINFPIRIGFSSAKNKYDKTGIYIIPIEFNTLIGKRKHFCEIGIGAKR